MVDPVKEITKILPVLCICGSVFKKNLKVLFLFNKKLLKCKVVVVEFAKEKSTVGLEF